MKIVKVTAPEANGLRCPFTGDKLEVFMTVQPGSVTFSSPGAFTLKEPVSGLDVLKDRASMRNGVVGAASVTSVTDPYTGNVLELRSLGNGMFCYAGGFNPRSACKSLGEFLYRASMRNGKTDMAQPGDFSGVDAVRRAKVLRKPVQEPSAETVEAAEKAVEKSGAFEKPTSVFVSRKGKKSK